MSNSQDQALPKLLVAVADRESSRKAIQTASTYARALNAELILVNVLGDPHRVGVVAQLIESDLPVIEAKLWLKETIDSLSAVGVTSSFLLLRGEVGAVIVREAVEQAAQLVVHVVDHAVVAGAAGAQGFALEIHVDAAGPAATPVFIRLDFPIADHGRRNFGAQVAVKVKLRRQ